MRKLNTIYSLNSDYILRHDKYRSFIFSYNKKQNSSSVPWQSVIHPVQAAIFSFFTHGKKLKDVISDLSLFLNMNKNETLKMINPFIENKEEFHTKLGAESFNIPKNLIIPSTKIRKEYFPENFEYEKLDFKTIRFYTAPSSITFMLSNTCATQCVYCYADTKHKIEKHLPLNRILEIIEEAHSLDCFGVDIIGGEIFLYPHWKEIFEHLIKFNFYPTVISTKIPIKEDDIVFLKNKGIEYLQISLDSANDTVLAKTLKRKDNYLQKMNYTLQLCDKYDMPVQIATTLTKYTATYPEIKKLLNELKHHKSIRNIDLGVAFYSLYRPKNENYEDWGINRNEYEELIESVKKIEQDYPFKINFDTSSLEKQFYSDKGGSANFKGAACSANSSHLFILPDGKATVCEQLYWNDNFIVGDMNTQSITEVWNSPQSLHLDNLQQKDFPKDSACSTCKIFDQCHADVNKCWADIIKAYGEDKWYYPDPRCAYAPKTFNKIIFEDAEKNQTKNLILS